MIKTSKNLTLKKKTFQSTEDFKYPQDYEHGGIFIPDDLMEKK